MIDLACIITTGGVILFYKGFCQIKIDILGKLVNDGLVSSKIQTSILINNAIRCKWLLVNELGLVFVIAYQEVFNIQFIEVLLEMMRDEFIKNVFPKCVKQNGIYKTIPPFDTEFEHVMQAWQLFDEQRQKKDKEPQQLQRNISQEEEPQEEDKSKEDEAGATSPRSDNDDKKARIEALRKNKNKSDIKAKSPPNETKGPTKGKSNSVIIPKDKITKKNMDSLDFSTKTQDPNLQSNKNKYLVLDEAEEKRILSTFLDNNAELNLENKKGLFGRLTGGIKNITGSKELTEEDLQPVLADFKEALMGKNVAEEIAQRLVDSIKQKLLSTRTKAFTSVSRTVQECLRETLEKILTPKRNIDVVAEAMRSREAHKPYVIVFIGVNGVGKSTTLSKVAYLFKSLDFSVMIAACDNFRAGAVEQVKQHGECLGIPVYDRGYRDDPPEIAYQAIREATLKKIDIVLVDTAGRMQHNEPLMRSLSRIVTVNNPDLVVFIGEALVGNDGVDQLINFNKALIDNSPKDNIREIDAIILSKFDTVDEKVGAALSLTSATGKPIIFVGVGQKYTHLRKLNVNTVVQALLS